MTPEEFWEKWEPTPTIDSVMSPQSAKQEFMHDLQSLVTESADTTTESEYQRLKCICCNRVMESDANPNPFIVSPVYGGLRFRTQGGYGSSIFDPMPIECEDMLEVVICDMCLKKKASRVTVITSVRRKTTATREEFKP